MDTREKPRESGQSLKKGKQSPKLREQPRNPKNTLFSASSRQAGCLPPASSRATRPAPASPYKSSSSSFRASASDAPASLRAYLEGLKPDNLVNGIFRDQTTANAGNYPAAWISQIQASLEEPVSRLLDLAPEVLAAMPKKNVNRLYPAAGCDEGFDWARFNALCASLWPRFSGLIISLKTLPPQTLGLLAEFCAELDRLPAFSDLGQEARDKSLSNALFNLLIWNGIFSQLIKSVPEQFLRLVNGLCAYVKAAWGTQAQTKGTIGGTIASMVPDKHVEQCAAFRASLVAQVESLAARRTLTFHDKHDDRRLNKLREKNIDRHFTETWLHRADDYVQVVRQGNYYLTDAEGVERRCRSFADLSKYVGNGGRNSLPQVVLHVAGERIKNFLCHTYLYDSEKPIFTDVTGQRVDPVATALQTRFTLIRNADGLINVKFSCVDDAVESAMLVGPDDERSDMDVTPLFKASLEFHGEMHFHPNEEFEAGNILVTGSNLHMFQ